MNKLIIGGALVAVMGGTPVVTYFLTGEKEESVVVERKETNIPVPSGSAISGDTPCQPQEPGKTCPGAGGV